jgi:hypothetical protein
MKQMLVAAGVFALVASGLPVAYANPPQVTTFQDNNVFYNACTGENVQLTGTTTVAVAQSLNKNTYHVDFHGIQRDAGVGQTSGATYIDNAETNSTTNGSITGLSFEVNGVLNGQLIGHGGVPNGYTKQSFHLTVNPDGTIIVNRDSFEFTCQS